MLTVNVNHFFPWSPPPVAAGREQQQVPACQVQTEEVVSVPGGDFGNQWVETLGGVDTFTWDAFSI